MKKYTQLIFCISSFFVFLLVPLNTILSQTDKVTNNININQKVVALTFDDGPYGTYTERVLNILKKENVSATFFLIGKNVKNYPLITKKILALGNVIGNHTYSHSKKFAEMPVADFVKDLNQAESIITSTTNLHLKLFRPPYGNISPMMQKELKKRGYTTVMWNVDPRDWDLNKTPKQIENNIVNNIKPNSIIVLHDGHETANYSRVNIVTALPKIIEDLKKMGYTFMTVDKLLGKVAYSNK